MDCGKYKDKKMKSIDLGMSKSKDMDFMTKNYKKKKSMMKDKMY